MRKFSYKYALLVAPLLMGAGNGSISSELTLPTLPGCNPDQYLVYRSGGLVCETLSSGPAVQFLDCVSKSQLLTIRKNGDVTSFACADKGTSGGPVDMVALTNLKTEVDKLKVVVDGLPAGSLTRPYYRGSAASTAGYMKNGTAHGIAGAAKYCAADANIGAGGHACDYEEMYGSITDAPANMALGKNKQIAADSWVFFPNWQVLNNNSPNKGLGDNCATFMYSTAHLGWTGRTVGTLTNNAANPGNIPAGPWFMYFNQVGCTTAKPIACCK